MKGRTMRERRRKEEADGATKEEDAEKLYANMHLPPIPANNIHDDYI